MGPQSGRGGRGFKCRNHALYRTVRSRTRATMRPIETDQVPGRGRRMEQKRWRRGETRTSERKKVERRQDLRKSSLRPPVSQLYYSIWPRRYLSRVLPLPTQLACDGLCFLPVTGFVLPSPTNCCPAAHSNALRACASKDECSVSQHRNQGVAFSVPEMPIPSRTLPPTSVIFFLSYRARE